MTPEILARIAAARTARDLSDLARQELATAAEPLSPAARIERARRLRKMIVAYVDQVVLAEVLGGASWGDVGQALRPQDPESVREEYEDAVTEWEATPEEALEAAADGFEALDSWYSRHREDHDPAVQKPVGDLLNRH
ncbi:hypothetical protein HHL19_35295 [Streptomyces sp. R302]|uniref:hypothetical protein n=1 Tax=unclassified Streptomyces TaxID=2593676 RepID=UPI00145C7205|nr:MULTISPECIES: hypothetical protein [unclassified Streptomyces]NML55192.1 hypothetical protein [Streptomyces sp. R301]NML83778.1 hypothetical protein [Streptomyces sp. R302]